MRARIGAGGIQTSVSMGQSGVFWPGVAPTPVELTLHSPRGTSLVFLVGLVEVSHKVFDENDSEERPDSPPRIYGLRSGFVTRNS